MVSSGSDVVISIQTHCSYGYLYTIKLGRSVSIAAGSIKWTWWVTVKSRTLQKVEGDVLESIHRE